MRFWIECTRFETGHTVHINIALVGSMWRDSDRTVLVFVGGDAQTVEVTETPEHCSRSISALRQSQDSGMTATPADGEFEGATTVPDLRRVGGHPDHWYPVAWSHELKAGKTFATQFAGEPIVLVRPESGALFALEDRCAHRQVPLSKGTVDGCTLRCCYHGWRYDASGRCVDVSYLKEKLPNGVRRYPSFERDGVIFVWPGRSSPADPPDHLGAASAPGYKTRRFGGLVHCHYSFMHENLMDMHHQFLHRKTSGRVTPRYLGKRAGEQWLELDYSFRRPDEKPPIGETLIVGRWRGESASPRDLMTIRTEYPYQTLRLWTSGELPVLHVWLGYTPVNASQHKNRTFIVLSVRRPRLPGVLEMLWPVLTWFTNRVFDEDREIVELEQAAYDAQGGDLNQEVFPAINELRELLARCGAPIRS